MADLGLLFACATAGAVTGIFGAGGGMVLIPMLSLLTKLTDKALFSTSITVIGPICLVCLTVAGGWGALSWPQVLPWLAGSALGGTLAGYFGRRIPVLWLHRALGILILWGGVRYLWS